MHFTLTHWQHPKLVAASPVCSQADCQCFFFFLWVDRLATLHHLLPVQQPSCVLIPCLPSSAFALVKPPQSTEFFCELRSSEPILLSRRGVGEKFAFSLHSSFAGVTLKLYWLELKTLRLRRFLAAVRQRVIRYLCHVCQQATRDVLQRLHEGKKATTESQI